MSAAIFVNRALTKRKCSNNTAATDGGKGASVTVDSAELPCGTSPSITAAPHHHVIIDDTSSVTSSSSSSAHPQHGPPPCWMLAAAAVRGPAWSILALQFLIPGTVYGAVLCLSSGEDSELGGVALLLGMASLATLLAALVFIIRPTAVYVTYPTTLPSQHIVSSLEKRLGLLPTAHWAPPELIKSFSPLLTLRPAEKGGQGALTAGLGALSLALADIVLTCLLASASALGVGTEGASCSYAPPIVAAAYFLFAIVLCALQPQRLPTDRLLSPIVAALVGITCIMKNLEDTVVVETLLSVTQLFQMGIRLWVMFREWQWQRSAAPPSSSSMLKDSGGVYDDDPFSLELSTLPNNNNNSNNTAKSPTAHSGSEKDEEDSFVWTAGGAGNLMVMDQQQGAVNEDAFWDKHGQAIAASAPTSVEMVTTPSGATQRANRDLAAPSGRFAFGLMLSEHNDDDGTNEASGGLFANYFTGLPPSSGGAQRRGGGGNGLEKGHSRVRQLPRQLQEKPASFSSDDSDLLWAQLRRVL